MISQEDINKLIDIPGYKVERFHFEQQGLRIYPAHRNQEFARPVSLPLWV